MPARSRSRCRGFAGEPWAAHIESEWSVDSARDAATGPLQRSAPSSAALAALSALGAGILANACAPERGPLDPSNTPGRAVANDADRIHWSSAPDDVGLEPHAAVDRAGRRWTAWIRFDEGRPGAGLALVVACAQAERELARVALAVSGEWIAEPRLAAAANGVYCAWEEGRLDGAERRIAGSVLALRDGHIQVGERESIAEGPALFPRLVETRPGVLEAVYVRPSPAGDLELVHRVRTEDGGSAIRWSEVRELYAMPAAAQDHWVPRVAADRSGRLHVVHDAHTDGRFDVHYAILQDGVVTETHTFATGAGYQGFPSIALEDGGAAWIAWEEAAQFGELGGLRAGRSLALVRVADGLVRRALSSSLPPPGTRCDFPQVAASGAGLLVTFRGLGPPFAVARAGDDAPRPAEQRDRAYLDPQARFFTTFWTRVLVFDAEGRPELLELPATEGDNPATETLLVESDRTVAVLTADARSRAVPRPSPFDSPIEGRWRVGHLTLPATNGFPATEPLAEGLEAGGAQDRRDPRSVRDGAPLASPSAANDDATGNAAGGPKPPFFGDLHRHTSLSRCAGAYDGTLLDVYRYARGPGRLDFVAVTDHFQHLRPWSWWRNLRDATRFDAPGRLVTFAAVERAAKDRGHRNDVYADLGDVPFDVGAWSAFPERAGARGPAGARRFLSIPHMMGRSESPWRWEWFQRGSHALLEVFQGARGSYEGPGLPFAASDLDVPRASVATGLGLGHDFGFVAASDHGSSSTGLAGVYALELTREALFDALRARASFATTDFARVDLRLGSLRMGEVGAAGVSAALAVNARGMAPVAALDVVKNGATWRYECGAGASELFVLTSRRFGPYPDRPMRIAGRGAHIESFRVRRRGVHEAELAFANGELSFSKRREPLDIVLAIAADPAEDSELGALEFGIGSESVRVTLAEVERGRSRALPAPVDREQLLRIGPSLAEDELAREYVDPEMTAGDVYYVRVLFEDGNVAWSSPIRVTEVLR